jgi:hypothetical protein
MMASESGQVVDIHGWQRGSISWICIPTEYFRIYVC